MPSVSLNLKYRNVTASFIDRRQVFEKQSCVSRHRRQRVPCRRPNADVELPAHTIQLHATHAEKRIFRR